MTRFLSQSAAAMAAILIVMVSMNSIVTIPPAQANDVSLPVLA